MFWPFSKNIQQRCLRWLSFSQRIISHEVEKKAFSHIKYAKCDWLYCAVSSPAISNGRVLICISWILIRFFGSHSNKTINFIYCSHRVSYVISNRSYNKIVKHVYLIFVLFSCFNSTIVHQPMDMLHVFQLERWLIKNSLNFSHLSHSNIAVIIKPEQVRDYFFVLLYEWNLIKRILDG